MLVSASRSAGSGRSPAASACRSSARRGSTMREALDRLVDATRQERGVVRFEVGFDPDDQTRVLGYEIWASQDALDEHKAKAHTREFLARARELVVDPAVPMRTGRWRPMREELPAAYVPGTPGFAPPAAPPPGFTSERRLVNDVRMHYVIGGSGTPVVLLPRHDISPRVPGVREPVLAR
jgi:quinol monooxygenase YgiN